MIMNDTLSQQLYETIYPVVVKYGDGGFPTHTFFTAWGKFVDETVNNIISVKGAPSVPDSIDQELKLKYDGAYYEGLIRFKSESAVTMFLLRWA